MSLPRSEPRPQPAADADPACTGVRWCLALLDGLAAGGVRHLVLSPGSRSTPAILAAQRRRDLVLTPILDERSAAFHALGLARASGRPVALLATSGSAPAHWYPAAIEASESGVPLVLISADRPPELRGWGANQTIDQTRLFGAHVRAFFDPGPPHDAPGAGKALAALGLRAAAASQGWRPGPVHINLPLREPLVPTGDCAPGEAPPRAWAVPRDEPGGGPAADLAGGRPGDPTGDPTDLGPPAPDWLGERLVGRGLICCGPGRLAPGFASALWRCARALQVPVLADPLCGLRFGAGPASDPGRGAGSGASPGPGSGPGPGPDDARMCGPIARYDTFLRAPRTALALRPDWVLRFGRAPVSRTLNDWLAGCPTVLVDPAERWADPNHDLVCRIAADPTRLCASLAVAPRAPAGPDWNGRWAAAERAAAALAARLLDHAPWCEAHLIRDLLRLLPAGDGLFCANSLPIRQLDTWSGCRAAPLRVFGNRGASGIDGQLSTLSGLNAGGVPTAGLLGDLSFLHDLSGLMLGDRLDRPCIVLNNGGGRIFDYLPQHGLPDFERLWRTPRPLDLGALARPFGIAHRRVEDAAGWLQALTEALTEASSESVPGPAGTRRAAPGGALIEVMVDAPRSHALHQELWRQARELTPID